MSGANTIKVVARFRPQNKVENASGGQPVVSFEGDDTCSITVRGTKTIFCGRFKLLWHPWAPKGKK